jgi:hypothetical protein
VFKGGLLLAQHLKLARETTDVDLLLTRMDGSTEKMEAVFREICLVDASDGFDFKLHTVNGLSQPHMQYGGFRVDIEVHLGKMRDHVQVDVGIGDRVAPVTDSFRRFEYKGQPIFGGEISVLTYPVETIFAEKLETIVSKGVLNSRMKDFHDVLLMVRTPNLLDVTRLPTDINQTFEHRGTVLQVPIKFDDCSDLQQRWKGHLRGLGRVKKDLDLPDSIEGVLAEISGWLDTNLVQGGRAESLTSSIGRPGE